MATLNPYNQQNVPFQHVLDALLDNRSPFPAVFLHRFSDIEPADLGGLKKIWDQISVARRRTLLEDMENLAEADTLLCFDDLARFALEDSDAQVRTLAIRLLWETEDRKLIPIFTHMLENDPDSQVRAAAATAMGLFVYLGELEELPGEALRAIEDVLLRVVNSNDVSLIRRRALESLGYSGRSEVAPLIEKAYSTGEPDWLASSLFAMGRSADERWTRNIMRHLDNPNASIQLEAVRAAGELEITSARGSLLRLLRTNVDEDVQMAAVWSLSQIGGETVRPALEHLLENTEDEETADFIENALDNLSFTEDMDSFNMFDVDVDEIEDTTEGEPIEQEEEDPSSDDDDR